MFELIVTDLQLHAALALIVLHPVHELDLLQVLVVELLPLGSQGLVASTVLLQVGHHLVPLLCDTLSLLIFQFQLEQRRKIINTNSNSNMHIKARLCLNTRLEDIK